MKPAPFKYLAPDSVDESVALIAEYGDDAKILAGGQSLVPMQNLRLARPGVIIDINGIQSLDYVTIAGDTLAVGALARHETVAHAGVEGPLGALLADVGGRVGHLPIRLRGTFCGSLAHADPAAEWCSVLTALDGTVVAQGARGRREVPASEFFQTTFTTALLPDELIVEARLPTLGPEWLQGSSHVSLRAGDFSIGLVVVAVRTADGVISEARIALGGVADRAVRVPDAEDSLRGVGPAQDRFQEAGMIAAATVDPLGDLRGTAEFRRHLTSVLVERALTAAVDGASGARGKR